jgi:predicted AlkP superfamily phosphohydrolase/phosphomutase
MNGSKYLRRVLVIGLDAADIELLQLWGIEGSLPVIQSLMNKGVWGKLRTITNISHTAVWPSIFTGTNPGKHGIYNFFQASPYAYEINRVKANQCGQPPFWKYLDDSGKRCIVIDAPFDYAIDGFRGVQVHEWGSWVRYTHRGSNPQAIWNELVARFGIPPIENEATAECSDAKELIRLRDWLIEGIEKKGKAIKWLMNNYEWELMVSMFPETHPAGHFFWHLHDKHYPSHSEILTSKIGNHLKEIYEKVDSAIGQIVSHLNENDILIIVSGDSIGPNYSAWHLLPEILTRLDLMASKGGRFELGSGGGVSNRNDLMKRLRDKIPGGFRKKISTLLPETVKFRIWRRWTSLDLNWSETKVFYVPNDCQGHIRFNVKGREPFGCVEPGAEYDELFMTIKEQLEELINPRNGKRAVKDVIRTDQIFSGELTDQLPDLVIVWDENARTTTELFSKSTAAAKSERSAYALPPFYVGNHREPGFVIICSPGVGCGRLNNDSHIYDIAPTILSLLQCPVPTSMDGKIWNNIL